MKKKKMVCNFTMCNSYETGDGGLARTKAHYAMVYTPYNNKSNLMELCLTGKEFKRKSDAVKDLKKLKRAAKAFAKEYGVKLELCEEGQE